MTQPIVRITVAMPFATPISFGRTFSEINVNVAESASPVPGQEL